MKPWDKAVGSRTVSDVTIVIGREGSALCSGRRVLLRRQGSDSAEEEERERVGD